MGLLSAEGGSSATLSSGRDLWRDAFGASEETRYRPPEQEMRRIRYKTPQDQATAHMLRAFRSGAPGNWSDDRYEQSRHFSGVTYLAVHRCGEQMLQSEFKVYERDDNHENGLRPVRKGHPGYELNRRLERPNPDESFGELMYAWNQQMDLTGMALTWLVPNAIGTISEMYPLDTALCIPLPITNPNYPHGAWRVQPLHPYGPFSTAPTPPLSTGAVIGSEWVMRVKYKHPLLRYDGYSPQTAGRLELDALEMMNRSRFYSMKRSINPSAVLKSENADGSEPLTDPQIQRLKAEFEREAQGSENHGRLLVAEPGWDLELFGMSPKEMDYAASWEQMVGFTLALFGITKPAAGMIEDSSYSTLFATLKQLHLLTLRPKCIRIGSKLTRDVARFYGDDLVVVVECPRIDDHEVKLAKLDFLAGIKALKKNEARSECDMPVTREPWGEDIAGDPSPKEEQQMQQEQQAMMGQPGIPGQPGQPGQPQQPGQPGQEQDPNMLDQFMQGFDQDQDAEEDEETEAMRPTPGKLGLGSLGPRKSLPWKGKALNGKKSSTYDRVLEAIR